LYNLLILVPLTIFTFCTCLRHNDDDLPWRVFTRRCHDVTYTKPCEYQ
jgi:hypothetical protein